MSSHEQEVEPAQLTHLGLDLTEGVVSLFGNRGDDLIRFRFFLPPGLQALLGTHPLTERSVERLLRDDSEPTEAPRPTSPPAAATSKVPTVVLPGRLQTTPKEGRADRQQKPTALAQLLAHLDGQDGATLLSTSFHGKAREIALTLQQGDHLTAQGYLHLRAADAPDDRLSTFSVIHLIQYPGKPVRS
jgi:hypothetical protein